MSGIRRHPGKGFTAHFTKSTAVSKRAPRPRPVPGLERLRGRARRIVTLDDPDRRILRSRSRPVKGVDAPLRRLIADMAATMRRAHGVGLAAVQVGVPLRVLVADSGTGRAPVALVNPRVRRRWRSQIGPEGCLSIPGAFGIVRRALGVEVAGLDARGRPVVVRGTGLLARILQHEMDHLNGVLFTDRMGRRRLGRRRAPVRPGPGRAAAAPAVSVRAASARLRTGRVRVRRRGARARRRGRGSPLLHR